MLSTLVLAAAACSVQRDADRVASSSAALVASTAALESNLSAVALRGERSVASVSSAAVATLDSSRRTIDLVRWCLPIFGALLAALAALHAWQQAHIRKLVRHTRQT